MSRHRQFRRRGEDANAKVISRVSRGHDKGRLRKVQFLGKRLHEMKRQLSGVGEDGERVAAKRPIGKDINQVIIKPAHPFAFLSASLNFVFSATEFMLY
jgi:hypothetical protein